MSKEKDKKIIDLKEYIADLQYNLIVYQKQTSIANEIVSLMAGTVLSEKMAIEDLLKRRELIEEFEKKYADYLEISGQLRAYDIECKNKGKPIDDVYRYIDY